MFKTTIYENEKEYLAAVTPSGTIEEYENLFGELEYDGYWLTKEEDGKIVELMETWE